MLINTSEQVKMIREDAVDLEERSERMINTFINYCAGTEGKCCRECSSAEWISKFAEVNHSLV